jgi:eukaryotic-like serine/threonine-protein kinase
VCVQMIVAVALTDAVDDLHRAEFCHLELSTESVVLSADGTIKLSEFGVDRQLGCYAPEQLEADSILDAEATSSAGEAWHNPCDVWGTGATLLHAFTGKQPCEGQSRTGLLARMRDGEVGIADELQASSLPDHFKTVLAQCFRIDPLQRITSADLHEQIKKLAAAMVGAAEAVQANLEQMQRNASLRSSSLVRNLHAAFRDRF